MPSIQCGRDLAGDVVVRVPVRVEGGQRAGVGRVAQVPVAGAGRVDLDPVGEPGVGEARAQHGLPDRRAADVAEAHDGDPVGGGAGGHGRRLGRGARRVFVHRLGTGFSPVA